MTLKHVGLLVAAMVVLVTVLWVYRWVHTPPELPAIYPNIDKTKPWSEIAKDLDPLMSQGEYDAIRRQYFYDVWAPRLRAEGYNIAAHYEEFARRTELPWRWDRRRSSDEPPRVLALAFVLAVPYLLIVGAAWLWRSGLRPLGHKLREEGLAGLGRRILYGRKGKGTGGKN